MSHSIARVTLICLLLLLCGIAPHGQEAPTLTDTQRLTLNVKYLQYENAKLRLDAAQKDLVTFVQELQKPGFTFDVGSGTYTPVLESSK